MIPKVTQDGPNIAPRYFCSVCSTPLRKNDPITGDPSGWKFCYICGSPIEWEKAGPPILKELTLLITFDDGSSITKRIVGSEKSVECTYRVGSTFHYIDSGQRKRSPKRRSSTCVSSRRRSTMGNSEINLYDLFDAVTEDYFYYKTAYCRACADPCKTGEQRDACHRDYELAQKKLERVSALLGFNANRLIALHRLLFRWERVRCWARIFPMQGHYHVIVSYLAEKPPLREVVAA